MARYILKRIVSAIPVLLIVVFIVFFVVRMLPGNVAVMILGKEATPEALATLEETLGLNEPIFNQFINYIVDL